MKTKVVIEYRSNSSWLYMVYVFNQNNKWIPVQYFDPVKREEAINYARDISTVSHDKMDQDIWMSE